MKQEAWLSGPIEGVAPVLMPAAHALAEAATDLERAAGGLSNEELWEKPNNAPSVGFHLLHIAGSIDRLLTYSRGAKLTSQQFDELAAETQSNRLENAQTLIEKAHKRIEEVINVLRSTDEAILFEKRTVGRQELPTNVFGLLFHIAEHTQRHVGQIVATAKIVRKG